LGQSIARAVLLTQGEPSRHGTGMDFAPHAALAARLLAFLGPQGTDGSHDLTHIQRVWRNALAIAATEPETDTEILLAAVVLHDCVTVEKDSPLRSQASRLSADRARELVVPLGWPPARVDALAHAIATHSFSAGLQPETLDARIMQDADRLDAIGAIGVARCFYIAGRMQSGLYSPEDPSAKTRALDDRRFALDHFEAKLFQVVNGFLTPAGQAMAVERGQAMHAFVDTLLEEIGA
jgi:uncharacterized protein